MPAGNESYGGSPISRAEQYEPTRFEDGVSDETVEVPLPPEWEAAIDAEFQRPQPEVEDITEDDPRVETVVVADDDDEVYDVEKTGDFTGEALDRDALARVEAMLAARQVLVGREVTASIFGKGTPQIVLSNEQLRQLVALTEFILTGDDADSSNEPDGPDEAALPEGMQAYINGLRDQLSLAGYGDSAHVHASWRGVEVHATANLTPEQRADIDRIAREALEDAKKAAGINTDPGGHPGQYL